MSAAEVCDVTGFAVTPRYMRLARALAQPVQPEPQDAATLRRLQALATAMGPRGTASFGATAHGAGWFTRQFAVILSGNATDYQHITGATTDAALTAAEAWVAQRESVA